MRTFQPIRQNGNHECRLKFRGKCPKCPWKCPNQSTESPIFDASFWSENGVSCPQCGHERNKIGDSVLWSEWLGQRYENILKQSRGRYCSENSTIVRPGNHESLVKRWTRVADYWIIVICEKSNASIVASRRQLIHCGQPSATHPHFWTNLHFGKSVDI